MKKTISILSLTALVSACASLSNQEPKPMPFANTERQIMHVDFMKLVTSNRSQPSSIEGVARIRHADGHRLNEYFIERLNNDLAISLVDADGNDVVMQPTSLSNSQALTLYTFGKLSSHVEQTKVSASNGICQDYANNGIEVTIANNYYHNNYQQFVTFYSAARLSKTKLAVHTAWFDYANAQNLTDLEQITAVSAANLERSTKAHYLAFKGFIEHIICAQASAAGNLTP